MASILGLCLALALLSPGVLAPVVQAQTSDPDLPTSDPDLPTSGPRIHVVVAGDTLTGIAEQYGVTIAQLQLVNHLQDDDILGVGSELVIPGGNVSPAVIIYTTLPGNSIQNIASSFALNVDDVLQTNRTLNRETIPAVGQPLALLVDDGSQAPEELSGIPHIVQEGETLLELAAHYDMPVSHLIYINNLQYPVRLYPGQRLRIPDERPFLNLPGEWTKIEVNPPVISQGDTVSVYVENLLSGEPFGQFGDQELHFAADGDGFVALAGVDAFAEAGRYRLALGGAGERPWYPFEQDVAIADSNFPSQSITVTEDLEYLLEPSIRSNEDAFLSTIYGNYSEEKQWDDVFQVPVTDTVVTAPYGGGRSYNEGPVTIFHTGTDFGGGEGTPILAAANGTVVFNDELELRGNTVILDHGWGVMTGYYHLSESFVELGQKVERGQPVGLGGSTGLSTGPHLHWELRIMDVAVNGMRWTTELFP